nr:unnamed protein product [Callosobruchus analis]
MSIITTKYPISVGGGRVAECGLPRECMALEQLAMSTGREGSFCKKMAIDWYKYCREMTVDHYSTLNVEHAEMLGGSGVLRMIEQSERKHVRMIEVSQRDTETFGPIVHADMWRTYSALTDAGYSTKKVNHSDPEHRFVGMLCMHIFNTYTNINNFPCMEQYTQRIEAKWSPTKN